MFPFDINSLKVVKELDKTSNPGAIVINNKFSLFKSNGPTENSFENLTEFSINICDFATNIYKETDDIAKYEVRIKLFNNLIASYIRITQEVIQKQAKYITKEIENKNISYNFISNLFTSTSSPEKKTETVEVQDGYEDVKYNKTIDINIIPKIECNDDDAALKERQKNKQYIHNLFNYNVNALKSSLAEYCANIIYKVFKNSSNNLDKNVINTLIIKDIDLSTLNLYYGINSSDYITYSENVFSKFLNYVAELSMKISGINVHNDSPKTRSSIMRDRLNESSYQKGLYDLSKQYKTLKLAQEKNYSNYAYIWLDSLFPSFDLLNLKHHKTCNSITDMPKFNNIYDSYWTQAAMNTYINPLKNIKHHLEILFDTYEKERIGDLENPKPTFLQMLRNRMRVMMLSVVSVKDKMHLTRVGNIMMKRYLITKDIYNDTSDSASFNPTNNTAKSVEEMIENMSPMGARWILLPTAEFNNVARALYKLCHRATASYATKAAQSLGLSNFKETYGGREAGKKTYVVYNGRRYLVRKLDRKRAIKVNGALMALRDLKGWKKV